MSDIVLDVVAPNAADWLIQDAIIGGELERTIDGASTLTLSIHDPHKDLIRSKGLQKAVDLQYDGTWFRLVKLAKSGVTVTLTFEDRDVAYLRRHDKPRKVSRGKSTRAQFVRSLVREVKQRVEFFCPEVNEKQPIGKPKRESKTTKRTKKTREDDKQKGIPKDAQVAVKGVGASPEQRRNAEKVLDVADQLGAGPKATKALIEAVIVESGIKNLNYGDRDSLGILQVRVSTSGSAAKSKDIEWCVTKFLKDGFYKDPDMGSGGAMEKARKYPHASAGRVAQATQGSGVPGAYDIFADEADDWLDAYGGASGNDTGGSETTTTTTRRKKAEFSRGEPGKREDSWTCIQRLASEVNWRAFMDRGTLYFVSEDRLISAKATYIVSEDTDGVSWIDFDIDTGKKVSEASVVARTDLFDVRIGSVMAIRDMGMADGRYIVAGVRRGLFDEDTEISLRRATPKLPEPAPETSTTTKTKTTGGGGGKGGKGGKWKLGSGANRAGVTLNRDMELFLDDMAEWYDGTIVVSTGTAHAELTTSGSVSNHWTGHAVDLGMVANGGSDDSPVGDKLAIAALRACSVPYTRASKLAKSGQLNFSADYPWRGGSIEIGWRTDVGGNHHNHVHIGIDEPPKNRKK